MLSILLSLPLGIFSAVRQYSFFDYIFTILSFIGLSLPPFWLALMAIYLFALKLQWLPPMGMSYAIEGDFIQRTGDLLWHLALPVAVLTIRNLASMEQVHPLVASGGAR